MVRTSTAHVSPYNNRSFGNVWKRLRWVGHTAKAKLQADTVRYFIYIFLCSKILNDNDICNYFLFFSEDSMCILSTESTGFSSHTKTQAFSEVVKTKEMSIVGSKNLKRLPTLWQGQDVASELGIYHISAINQKQPFVHRWEVKPDVSAILSAEEKYTSLL